MTLERGIEGFVMTFCRLRSQTYMYHAERVDGLWVLRDSPLRKRDRKIEIVSAGLTPCETVEAIRGMALPWHFIVAVHTNDGDAAPARREYKALGYKALTTEWMFAHHSDQVPSQDSDPKVRLVDSLATLASIRQQASQGRKFVEGTRLYCIWDDQRDYGWVRSVPHDGCGWAYDLYVYAEFRGRGFGRALMSRLLRDDRARGLSQSALIASSAGARLYPHLGYARIATLQIFCPVRGGSC